MAVNTSTVGLDPGRDYSSFTAAEADLDGDLPAQSIIQRLDFYNDGVMDDAFELAGSSTSTLYYWLIRTPADERHDGTVNSGARIVYDGAFSEVIVCKEDEARFEGLEIHTGSGVTILRAFEVNTVDAGDIRFAYGLIWGETNNANSRGIKIDDSDAVVSLFNNIIYDLDTTNGLAFDINAAGSIYAYNNTFYDNAYGIKRTAGTVYAKNNASFGNAVADFNGTFHADSDYNCSSDATAPGLNSKINRTASDNFVSVSAGSEDLRVKDTTADIYFSGTDLSADAYMPFFDDIGGSTRITWDIGADEYSAGANSRALVLAKKYYSIHKNGLTYIVADAEMVDLMSDIGDICTIQTGNPAITFNKAMVYKVQRSLGAKNRITLYCLTGGFMFDEDLAWT